MIDVDDIEASLAELDGEDILEEISKENAKTPNNTNETEFSCNITGSDIFNVSDITDASKNCDDLNKNSSNDHASVENDYMESLEQIEEIFPSNDDEIANGKDVETLNDTNEKESLSNVTENEIIAINDTLDISKTCNDSIKNTSDDHDDTSVIICSDEKSLKQKDDTEEINSNDSFLTAEITPIIDKLDNLIEDTESTLKKQTESDQGNTSNEGEIFETSNYSESTPLKSLERLEESPKEIQSQVEKISPKNKTATSVTDETSTLANGNSVSDINSLNDAQENEDKDDQVQIPTSNNKNENFLEEDETNPKSNNKNENSLEEDETNPKQTSSNITNEIINIKEEYCEEEELIVNEKDIEDSAAQTNSVDSENGEMNSRKATKETLHENSDEIKNAESLEDSINIKENQPKVAKELLSRRKTIFYENQIDQSVNNDEKQNSTFNPDSIKIEPENEDGDISAPKISPDKNDNPIKVKKRGRPKSINKVNETATPKRSKTEKLNQQESEDEKVRKSSRKKELPLKVKRSVQKISANAEETVKNKGKKKNPKPLSNSSTDVSNISMDNDNETEENVESDKEKDDRLLIASKEGSPVEVIKRKRGRPRKSIIEQELPTYDNNRKKESTLGTKNNDLQKESTPEKNVVPRKKGRPPKRKLTLQRVLKSEDESYSPNNKRRKLDLSSRRSESKTNEELSNKNDGDRKLLMKRESTSEKDLKRKYESDKEKENKKKSDMSYKNSNQEDEDSETTIRDQVDSPARKKSRASPDDKKEDKNSFKNKKQKEKVIQNNSHQQNTSKDLTDESKVTVRKRGRPRKHPAVNTENKILIKRGRGRPKKIRSDSDISEKHFKIKEENVVRKKRGRPRKSTVDNTSPNNKSHIDTNKLNGSRKRKDGLSKNKRKSGTEEALMTTENNSPNKTKSNSILTKIKDEIITDQDTNVSGKRQKITSPEDEEILHLKNPLLNWKPDESNSLQSQPMVKIENYLPQMELETGILSKIASNKVGAT